jgi:hypothetical protein
MTALRNRDPEPEYPALSWRGLGLSWAVLLATVVAGGSLLQTLGPPRDGLAGRSGDRPVAQATVGATAAPAQAQPQHAANQTSEAAKGLSSEAIAALIAKVQAQIADSPEGVPPGNSAAEMLKRVSAALPNASPQDRELANDMAADLYDRAKTALQAGKVDEEQHWLALGSILAPPPDLAPNEPGKPENTIRTAQAQASPAAAPPREDITPNEAEIEQPAQEQNPPAQNPPTGARAQRDIASAGASPDRNTQQHSAASAPLPKPEDGEAAATQPGTAESATPAEASSSTADGTQQTTGKGLSIHVLAGSDPAQDEKLKALADRLRSNFGQTQMHAEADVPRVAVVQYATPADHSMAKDVGRVLGAMGYPWHIERLPPDRSEATTRTVDVWLPSGESVPQEFRPRRRMHFHSRGHGWFPGWLRFWF